MTETKNEATYQPMTFDAIKIGLACPMVKLKSLKPSITEH